MDTQLTAEVVATAASLAGRAPSLHNTQPWHWQFDGRALHLYSVPDRMLTVTDPGGRQLLLSCGIALHHMRSALADLGWHTTVRRFPSPTRFSHLADLGFEPAPVVTEAEHARAQAISRRFTDRLPFGAPGGWDEFEPLLRTCFPPDDAVLDVLPGSAEPDLARISRLAAGLRRYDSDYHAELHWWTGHVVNEAGVPRTALISAEERDRVPVGRRMPAAEDTARRPDTHDESRILAVSTDSDRHEEILRAGEALSAVLLECTVAGYATCTLTHMTEFEPSRAELRKLLGDRVQPQALVRVGVRPADTEPVPPTPRLPLQEIFEVVPPPTRW
ncbi:Acg family FMN-binding oxidoreductase [Nocardia stercoris]|uniref:NAD(P)H nitroreductase n=1 Tax=Nocardia stercoris TaxID=2483361 RepID=A0A3M2LA33_9NOCA|nr:NAD(P)H nitroreductase [Nocardia stercoris]RMI33560.1 NAD(P)H nitroreductase [Nocardia stercoris]